MASIRKAVLNKKSMDFTNCIVSIDVGVKNLAICVLAKSKNGKVDILFWKWYNVLVDNDQTAPSNKGKKKKEKPDASTIGKCINVIRKTGKQCGRPGPLNTRGRAYCGVHDPGKKHNPQDTQEWCYGMLQNLPGISNHILQVMKGKIDENIIQVVIEQQSMDNKKILLQSHLIYGHFVTLFDNRVPVRFVPAYNKLLVYDGPEVVCALKTAYAKRKFLAKRHTEYYLRELPTQWKTFFDSCKTKQDDISDAFLQGLYILKGGAPKKENETGGGGRRRRKVRF